MSALYIVRGVPGSGKSTFARVKKAHHQIEADMYFTRPEDGGYFWNPGMIKDAHEWCRLSAKKAMHLYPEDDVYVCNTFIRMWEMEPYLKMAKEFKRDIKIVNMKSRYNSIHAVPSKKIDEMAANFYHIQTEVFPEFFGDMDYVREEYQTHEIMNFYHRERQTQ